MRAEGRWQAGQFAAASQLFRDAKLLGPLAARSLCHFGESLVQAGQGAEGREHLLEALHSDDAACHLHSAVALALSHVVDQQHDEALAYCSAAEDLYWSKTQVNGARQELKMVRALRALVQLRQGYPESVLEELRSFDGVEASPDPGGRSRPGWRWDELIQVALARARALCGDLDATDRHLEAARTLAGSSTADVLVAEAEIRHVRGDDQGAEQLLLGALAMDERPPLALFRLGHLLLCRGQPGPAVPPLRECLRQPTDSLAFGAAERAAAHLCLCVALGLSAPGLVARGARPPQDGVLEHLARCLELRPDLRQGLEAQPVGMPAGLLGPLGFPPEQVAVLRAHLAWLPAAPGGCGSPAGCGGASPPGRAAQKECAWPPKGPDSSELAATASTTAPMTASRGSSSPAASPPPPGGPPPGRAPRTPIKPAPQRGRVESPCGEESGSDNDQPSVSPVHMGSRAAPTRETARGGAGPPLARRLEPELAQALPRGSLLLPPALELGECISRGEFAAVHRGLLRGGAGEARAVVVKALREGGAGDDGGRAALLAEIRIMTELDHPRIVPFVGACLESGQVALVTGLAPGGNLHRALHVQRRQLVRRERLQLSLDLLEGVAHLHSRRPPVVHLDIKSMNLVLDAEGQRLLLCDFGLAQKLGVLGGHAGAAAKSGAGGSPRYMAPECYDSSLGPTTEKADVWSSACVLIEIFGSCLPYAECSNVQQILKTMLVHRRGPSVPISAEAPVRSAITSALAFEYHERPAVAQVLAQLRASEVAPQHGVD